MNSDLSVACRATERGVGRYVRSVSAATQTGSRPSRPSGIRVSRLILLVVALITVAGVLYLTLTSGTEEVYMAAVDLPAYHQLTQADLRPMAVDRRTIPPGAVTERDRDTLLGRYTTTALRQDRPLQLDMVGPRLPIDAIESSIVALPWNPETSMGGRLARGDRVDILLSPNGPAQGPILGRRIAGVLVLDLVDGPNASVIVAMTQADVDEFIAARGSSTVLVARTRPYVGP
jgi:hypothetical protein